MPCSASMPKRKARLTQPLTLQPWQLDWRKLLVEWLIDRKRTTEAYEVALAGVQSNDPASQQLLSASTRRPRSERWLRQAETVSLGCGDSGVAEEGSGLPAEFSAGDAKDRSAQRVTGLARPGRPRSII